MKKKIMRISAGFIISAALILPSCEFIADCGTCELVTDNDGTITTGPPIPYCGDAYIEKDSSEPVTIGNITTYWSCTR